MNHSEQSPAVGTPAHGSHPTNQSRKLHKDWRLWIIVLLMLGLMIYYLATLDLR
jgi:hypothetical protein